MPRMFDEDATGTPDALLERLNVASMKAVQQENGAVALPALGALLVRIGKDATENANRNIRIADQLITLTKILLGVSGLLTATTIFMLIHALSAGSGSGY